MGEVSPAVARAIVPFCEVPRSSSSYLWYTFSFCAAVLHRDPAIVQQPDLRVVELYLRWPARTSVGKLVTTCNITTILRWWEDLRFYFKQYLNMQLSREDKRQIERVRTTRTPRKTPPRIQEAGELTIGIGSLSTLRCWTLKI